MSTSRDARWFAQVVGLAAPAHGREGGLAEKYPTDAGIGRDEVKRRRARGATDTSHLLGAEADRAIARVPGRRGHSSARSGTRT